MEHEDEHILEAIGKTRIVVRHGQIVEVGAPHIEECPLARRFKVPVDKASPESVRANIEERIRTFGFCTERRQVLQHTDFVLFGASELMSNGIAHGLVDCAVIVCDGAGTVLALNPEIVQGIGGRMSGLIKTSPIPAVIDRIERNGGIVPFPHSARIDQTGGVAHAYEKGYSRIAVTVAGLKEAEEIRSCFPKTLIIGVHLTGTSPSDCEGLVHACDIISSCASLHLREYAGRHALVQGGSAIPVFAMTQRGKDLMIEKIRRTDQQVLVKGEHLPVHGKSIPNPLI